MQNADLFTCIMQLRKANICFVISLSDLPFFSKELVVNPQKDIFENASEIFTDTFQHRLIFDRSNRTMYLCEYVVTTLPWLLLSVLLNDAVNC